MLEHGFAGSARDPAYRKLVLGGGFSSWVSSEDDIMRFSHLFYLAVTYVSQVLWTYRLWLWGCWLAGSSWKGWVSLWRPSHVSLWWCWPSPPSSTSLCSGWGVQHRRFQRSIISRTASLGEFVCFIEITVILLICITSFMLHVKLKVLKKWIKVIKIMRWNTFNSKIKVYCSSTYIKMDLMWNQK